MLMFRRIGVLTTSRPKTILVVATFFVVVAAALGVHASSKLQSAGFVSPHAPSQLAADRLDAHFGGQPNLVLLVTARRGNVDSPAVAEAGRRLTARVASTPGLTAVNSYWTTAAPGLRSTTDTDALVVGTIRGSSQTVMNRTKTLVADLSTPLHSTGPVTVRVGGVAGSINAATVQIQHDLAKAEAIAIPITFVLLILAFGSIVAALLPITIGLLAIVATLAVLDVIGSLTAVSVYALNLATALGLGLGIDYALLMVTRYREELAGGLEPKAAVRRSVATAGSTIVFSAAAVAVALAVLLVFPMYFLRSFAYAGISVIAVAATAALFVLPAILALLGAKVNAGAVRNRDRLSRTESPFWRRVATTVMRHPVLTGVPVVALLLVLALPFLSVHWGVPDDRVLPTSLPARQVGDALRTVFPTNTDNNLNVVTEPALTPAGAVAYSRRLSTLHGIAEVTGPAGVWSRGRLSQAPDLRDARYEVPGATWLVTSIVPDPLSGQAESLVAQVRALPSPLGTSVEVGGLSASLVDQNHDIGSRLPLALGLIALSTFAILFLFTGSFVLPAKALVLNLLSLTAVFGAIVWVFQEGHLSGVLGFTPTPTSTTMPLLLFCIAFGLSMDYEVFMLSRIKELHDAGESNNDAVADGLARTGRIVTTAAAILAVTFIAFGLSKVSFIKMFGLATALAIVMDATLVRGVLVPAFMRLAGPANWWAPGPFRRFQHRLGFREA